MTPASRRQGFTLIEMLVTMAVIGILFSIAALSFQRLDNPVQDGVTELSSFLKQTRATALSTTSAYRLAISTDNTTLTATTAPNCATPNTSWTADPATKLTLPSTVVISAITGGTWPICITSRGFSTQDVILTLTGSNTTTGKVELLIGGGTKVNP
ncbi:prepilin-type N-terminal cleavage/methylation domain-containing protein (plasmid) [Deinococcus radiomollis]|uniref:pilus assembly FimT family protein n=1 Tax=Deinococcus radiomollis TaxID=468916 RepID=UPI003891548D